MPRRLALAALVLCALPSSAQANPSISVSASVSGVPRTLPAKVQHRLTLTAGAAPETVRVSARGPLTVSGDAKVGEQTAVGSGLFNCGTRWMRPHDAYASSGSYGATMTLAPFATAFVDTTTRLAMAPWDESLDAVWTITPAQGAAFDVVSPGPSYEGAFGVELGFAMTRVSPRVYAVEGTAESADSGRVELWGYAPGRKQARRLAVVPVRSGAWSIPRFRPSRRGRWEFYARYRTAGKDFANDASVCGTVVRVR